MFSIELTLVLLRPIIPPVFPGCRKCFPASFLEESGTVGDLYDSNENYRDWFLSSGTGGLQSGGRFCHGG